MTTTTNALDILTARAEARLAQRDETPLPAASTTTAAGPVLPTLFETYTKPLPVSCFRNIMPNTILVSPLRKPQKSAGGLLTSSKEEATHPAGAVAYVVLGIGANVEPEAAHFLPVTEGDIVLVRNMILEPLCESQEPLLCHRSGVLAVIELADVKFTTIKE